MSSIVLIKFLYRYFFDCPSKCLHVKLMLHFTECYDSESMPKKNFNSHCIRKVFMWIYLCNICEQWALFLFFYPHTIHNTQYTDIRHKPCRIRSRHIHLIRTHLHDPEQKAEKKTTKSLVFLNSMATGLLPSIHIRFLICAIHFCSLYIVFGCCYVECVICLCCATFGHQTQSHMEEYGHSHGIPHN